MELKREHTGSTLQGGILLIVLNGIETALDIILEELGSAFNRTKWNWNNAHSRLALLRAGF